MWKTRHGRFWGSAGGDTALPQPSSGATLLKGLVSVNLHRLGEPGKVISSGWASGGSDRLAFSGSMPSLPSSCQWRCVVVMQGPSCHGALGVLPGLRSLRPTRRPACLLCELYAWFCPVALAQLCAGTEPGVSSRAATPWGAEALCFFQVPPLPGVPPIAPVATVNSIPAAPPDQPAVSGPTMPAPPQYFPPTVLLPSLPLNAASLPTSPAMSLQAVKLPHPAGAPLAMPCRTIVPNVAATAIPLLAVAPQGVAALSVHPAVAQLPAQPVYPVTFPQVVPGDVPPSPLHVVQSVRATPPQPVPPTLPQLHQPSVTCLSAQAAAAGSQVIQPTGWHPSSSHWEPLEHQG